MPYSIQPRDQVFVKGYGFLLFAKCMGKNIGKIISKNLSGTYSQELLDHVKKSATDALKTTSEKVFQEIAEATGHLFAIKITNKLQKPQEFAAE